MGFPQTQGFSIVYEELRISSSIERSSVYYDVFAYCKKYIAATKRISEWCDESFTPAGNKYFIVFINS